MNINAKNDGIRSVVGPSNILLKSPIQYLTGLYDFVKNKDIMSKQIDAFESIDEVERITNTMGLQSFEEFSEKWENHCDWFKNIIRKVSRSLTNRINNDLQRPYFIVNLFLGNNDGDGPSGHAACVDGDADTDGINCLGERT